MNKYYEQYKDSSQEMLDDSFIDACRDGNLGLVKYLLTSPELQIHADILAENDGLQVACLAGYLDIIKYLLTSPELKEKASLHDANDTPFKYATGQEHLDVIRFFIFDLNMEKTPEIQSYLESITDSSSKKTVEEIEKMFTIRDLNKKLESELISDNANKKKLKL